MLALALAAYLASLAYLASWLLHILPLAYSCLEFVLRAWIFDFSFIGPDFGK